MWYHVPCLMFLQVSQGLCLQAFWWRGDTFSCLSFFLSLSTCFSLVFPASPPSHSQPILFLVSQNPRLPTSHHSPPSLPQPVTPDHWAPLHYGSWSSFCICCIYPQTEADLAANCTTISLLLFNRQNTTYWHNVLRKKIAERLQCLKMEVNLVKNLQ